MIKIALCDDNEIERGILKNVVEGLLIDIGYSAQVFEFSSGEKLLRNYSRGDYDVIFLDVQMKQLDGIETGRAIREKDVQEKQIYVKQALEQMNPELKEIIIMFYFQDFKLKEIADILQIGLPLVKYRHKRAKEELKRLLGEEDSHEPGKDDGNI